MVWYHCVAETWKRAVVNFLIKIKTDLSLIRCCKWLVSLDCQFWTQRTLRTLSHFTLIVMKIRLPQSMNCHEFWIFWINEFRLITRNSPEFAFTALWISCLRESRSSEFLIELLHWRSWGWNLTTVPRGRPRSTIVVTHYNPRVI